MRGHDMTQTILDRERIHTQLKNKMLDRIYAFLFRFFLFTLTYALFYTGFYFWLRTYAIYVHIAFIAIGVIICVVLWRRLPQIFMLSRMVREHRYLVVEDEIDYLEENAIKGVHWVFHPSAFGHSSLRREPRIEHSIIFKKHGRLLVEQHELKGYNKGDKVYLVLPEHKAEPVVLFYHARQYELHI